MRYLLLLLCIVIAPSASAQIQYLGSPTTTVRNRGNFVSDSLFYLPKRQKAPSDTGAIRYAISDSSVYVWTGYQWNKLAPGAFVSVGDTASMLSPYTRGSGTTNYVPKFTGTRTFGNSAILDNGTNVEIGSSASRRKLGVNRTPLYALDVQEIDSTNDQLFDVVRFRKNNNTAGSNQVTFGVRLKSSTSTPTNSMAQIQVGDQSAYRNLSLQVDKFLINDTSSIGSYTLQVNGSIYNKTGAVFAASSGDVGIGTTSPSTYSSAKFAVVKTSGTTVAAIVSTDATAGAGFYVQGSDASNNWFQIRQYSGSASGTTLGLNNAGSLQFFTSSSSTGALIINQQAAQPFVFATNNTERMQIKSDGELLIGTTTDAGPYALQVAGAIYNTTTLTTGAPTSGSAKPWRLGEAATVSPTSPNRTIRVEIDGTVYYIHAKTTND